MEKEEEKGGQTDQEKDPRQRGQERNKEPREHAYKMAEFHRDQSGGGEAKAQPLGERDLG